MVEILGVQLPEDAGPVWEYKMLVPPKNDISIPLAKFQLANGWTFEIQKRKKSQGGYRLVCHRDVLETVYYPITQEKLVEVLKRAIEFHS